MMPFAPPTMGDGAFYSAQLIANASIADGGTSATLASLGAQVGDLGVVLAGLGGPVSSGSGVAWTGQQVYYVTVLWWRKLSAADISAGVSVGRGGKLCIYRGASTLVERVTSSHTSNPQALTGFTRDQQHAGLISVKRAIDSGTDVGTFTTPAGWATRGDASYGDGSGSNYIILEDRLTPPNARYEGENTVLTYSEGSTSNSFTTIYELRS